MTDRPPLNGGKGRQIQRRAEAALELRMRGHDFADIATALGYKNARLAQTAMERVLGQDLDEERRDVARELNGRRIEALLQSVWAKATNPAHPEHLNAVRTARELIDRYARLYGLDRTEITLRTPSDDVLLRWVNDVLSYTPPTVIEADVIHGDDDNAERETTQGPAAR